MGVVFEAHRLVFHSQVVNVRLGGEAGLPIPPECAPLEVCGCRVCGCRVCGCRV